MYRERETGGRVGLGLRAHLQARHLELVLLRLGDHVPGPLGQGLHHAMQVRVLARGAVQHGLVKAPHVRL